MAIFTAMSIFTGYDGIGLGLKRAIPNLRTICYLEREIFPVCNLVAKIKENKLDDAPVWDDIATFDGKPFAGMVDILHAGIPCQPWSVAGKQKGIDDERWLWDDVFRVIVEVRPNYIFLEEVPGFVRGGGLGFVLSDLAKAGYDAEWDCFTAAEVGAPHKRERLFILAYAGYDGRTQNRQRNRAGELETATGGQSQTRNQQTVPSECGSELAHPRPDDGRRGRDNGEPAGQGRALQTEGPSELADASEQGLQGATRGELGIVPGTTKGNKGGESCGKDTAGSGKWPARPGQEQYDWEEPRVVDVANSRNKRAVKLNKRPGKGEIDEPGGATAPRSKAKRTAKSGMGRTVNGFASRVDELRLLGNGVVPAQAELAFRVLQERFTDA